MGRASIRTKAAAAARSGPTTSSTTDTSNPAGHKKKDKLAARHSAFVSRIEKASTKASTKNAARSRRRQKKVAPQLVTGLESLADALPTDFADTINFQSRSNRDAGTEPIAKNSIKSKPGAMKKTEKLMEAERDRFSKNLAIITMQRHSGEGSNGDGTAAPRQSPWAALRAHIAATMERKEEFVAKDGGGEGTMEVET